MNFCLRLSSLSTPPPPRSTRFFCSFLNSFRSFFIDVIEHFNPIITRLNDVTIDNHDCWSNDRASHPTKKVFMFEILIASIIFYKWNEEKRNRLIKIIEIYIYMISRKLNKIEYIMTCCRSLWKIGLIIY